MQVNPLSLRKGDHTQAKNPSGGLIRNIIEFAIVIIAALALSFVVTHYVCQPYEIPSESMESTIDVGDRVLSEKISYRFSEPETGQIITFENVEGEVDPSSGEMRVLIKRVIATQGQEVDLIDGQVYVDGVALNEPYTRGLPSEELSNPNCPISYPYTVPEGCVWVMGDNRVNSLDSRWFGPVPLENVTGHAFFTYWPFDRLGILE